MKNTTRHKFFRIGSFCSVLVVGLALLGHDVYLEAKGQIAKRLIESALTDHLSDGQTHRPWNWADFAPVGRLLVVDSNHTQAVLSGAAGESMAFGLGHLSSSARPGTGGNCVLAGHRDSWAKFMGDLRHNDRLKFESFGQTAVFRVCEMRVVPVDDLEPLSFDGPDRLTLITCYPLDGLTSSSERLIVTSLLEMVVAHDLPGDLPGDSSDDQSLATTTQLTSQMRDF